MHLFRPNLSKSYKKSGQQSQIILPGLQKNRYHNGTGTSVAVVSS